MEKIVLIGPVFPYKGGISHYTGLMCKALRKKYDVEMVSYSFQYPKFLYKKEQKDSSDDRFAIEHTNYMIHTANPLNWVTSANKIIKMKPKAVIIQWWHPYFAPCYTILTSILKKKKIPVIFICHNVFPHERFPLDRFLAKCTLKNGSGYIVQSKQDEHDLDQIKQNAVSILTPHPTYNVFKIRGIKKEEARKELKISRNEKMLLFFGFVREYKGLKYLIKALPDIKKKFPECKLYVVGDFGKDKEQYLQLIEKNNVENDIVIKDGYVPDGEVEPYFAACDLVVLPYISATQSGIVQIAYGFEKPVIATDVGGLPEVVLHDRTGYIAEHENESALAKAVCDFFTYNKADIFSKHIKEEDEKYSWDIMTKRITELIH